jgi:hypothetical protein
MSGMSRRIRGPELAREPEPARRLRLLDREDRPDRGRPLVGEKLRDDNVHAALGAGLQGRLAGHGPRLDHGPGGEEVRLALVAREPAGLVLHLEQEREPTDDRVRWTLM